MEQVVIITHNNDYLCLIKSILRNTFFNPQILDISNYLLCDDIILNKNKKLYIVEADRNKMFLNIIEKIRRYDWDSIIIIISKYKKYNNILYSSSLMIFSCIYMDINFIDAFSKSIKLVNKVIENKYIFVFKYKNVIYRLFYNDIDYIEKENGVKRCIIHTSKGLYYICSSISNLQNSLGSNFIRTHQSCIVNVDNICEITSDYIVFYDKNMTDLITKNIKNKILELIV